MRTTNRVAFSLALSVLVACAAIAAAVAAPGKAKKADGGKAGLPRYGMVVYSDLCVQDSGEFGGQRITVQRFAEVDTVIYEYTAGGLSWPLVASDVNIDPRGAMMYFTVQPPDEPERTISGKFSRDGETLTLDGGYCEDQSLPMTLAKVRDFGRKAKTCRACPAPKKAPAESPQDKPEAPKWEPAPPSQG
ncbi:hypothetical protein IP92_00201 [Pseudoduganella flava]|uniref:Uncharacterized protein n=1 Tax=Pseudoduganella flava TaxID=871742 RepID=A0A562Q3E8_9BURK|nr:hypothetical protein [Pseudoduganella flava]QGZ41279.1 hypothetical protein GO485_20915 [Pseudoduganella flava]TWI51218.1 hypothetical protein IP92_00201 [Pseudoduganella flava]